MSMQLLADETDETVPGGETDEKAADGGRIPGEETDRKTPTEETDAPAEETPDVRMDDEATAAFLERRGWGCLTLADGGAAYSVPMSFGYDGEGTLYFQIQTDDDSRKLSYLDATTTATFLVPEVRPPDWTSVVVRGEVTRVPDGELDAAYAAVADNAWFPACPWTPDKDLDDMALYKLDAEETTGRTSLVGE